MDEVKTWRLEAGASKVDVKLSTFAHSGSPQDTLLSFDLADKSSILTVTEIADLVDRVFTEMPGLGYAPEKLRRIAFNSDNSDVESGLNLAVAKSGLWRDHCLRVYACRKIDHVVSEYLIFSGALQPLERVLKTRHLMRTDVLIEEPGCALVPKSTPRTAEVGAQSLSCGGLILIDLGPQSDL